MLKEIPFMLKSEKKPLISYVFLIFSKFYSVSCVQHTNSYI